ncbi:MAG TPA: metalloregulator ArsR/SmtB family transcription factor [Herpetosiphonaceae bacterium]|nr:metalloregulator ArsR/SmtB family transcription factor [Herpetosiphonaceae bacterium]
MDVCGLAAIFKALSDPTRLQMMLILSRNGGKICVCDFERIFDLGQPTISHHLKILRKAGLLDCDRRGLWAYYFVQPSALDPLRRVLSVMTAH